MGGFRRGDVRGAGDTALVLLTGWVEATTGRVAFVGWARSENGGRGSERGSLLVALRRVLAFLADRASFLAGGGDMRLAGSVAVLLRPGDFSFAILESVSFGSALEWPGVGQFVP